MGETILAVYANPKILQWARETAGYSIKEAADKLGIEENKLIEIEKGQIYMTMNQLRSAADKYKRPLSIFFSSKLPKTFMIPDYRKKEIKEMIILDGDQRARVNIIPRKILGYKRNAEELYELNKNIINYDYIGLISPSDTVDVAADKVIQILKSKYSDLEYYADNEVLNYWIRKVEGLGILIFQFQQIESKYLRGMVYADTPFPVITINQQESYFDRCFTLITGFCHVLLGRTGICDVDNNPNTMDESIEGFCNKIANSVLMPLKKDNKQRTANLEEEDFYDQMSKTYIKEVIEAEQNRLISYYEALEFMDLNLRTYEELMEKIGNGELSLS